MNFSDARRLVESELAPTWRSGTLATGAVGYEDSRSYLVPFGDSRFIEGGDVRYAQLNAPAAFVDKTTGEVELVNYLDNIARVDRMSETF